MFKFQSLEWACVAVIWALFLVVILAFAKGLSSM